MKISSLLTFLILINSNNIAHADDCSKYQHSIMAKAMCDNQNSDSFHKEVYHNRSNGNIGYNSDKYKENNVDYQEYSVIVCETEYGSCELQQKVPPGIGCVCYGNDGYAIEGVTQYSEE